LQYGENLKRLNKFIGETGYCSRREADKIEQGRVTINGIVPELGTKVSLMTVRIDGKLIHDRKEKPLWLLINPGWCTLI
jgi:23S rRNA pseudouridine2604 synthase